MLPGDRTDQDDGYSERAATTARQEAEQALSPPQGHPRLWCDEPRIDGHPAVGRTIAFTGWAIGSSGAPRVTVSFDGREGIALHLGLERQDVADAFPGPGARESGWTGYLDVSGWEPGRYRAVITAHDPSGTVTTVTRWVHVDERERYARWLAARGTDAIERAGELAPCSLAVFVIDDGAGDSELERTLSSLKAQSHAPLSTNLISRGREACDGAEHVLEDIDGALSHLIEHDPEYAVFIAAGDLLESYALQAVALAARRYGPPDLIYADDDVLDSDGVRTGPRFKPQWSPELLLGTDYIGAFLAIGRDAARRARELEAEPVRNTYDLLLRLVDEDVWVERIADVLCTRTVRTAAADDGAGESIGALARRRETSAEVSLQSDGRRLVRWALAGRPTVSVVIPTAFRDRHLIRCLESIREYSDPANLELIIVDTSAGALDPALPILQSFEHQVVRFQDTFNYSLANNAGAAAARGDYLVFLNDDIQIETRGWLELMLAQAQQPKVGIVGVKMIYWDGLVQHGGVLIIGDGGHARQLFQFHMRDGTGEDPELLELTRNCAAVGTACAMMPRAVFDQLGGFDPHLVVLHGDVDLGLRVLNRGYRVVWSPEVLVRHHEAATRRWRHHPDDEARFAQRWERVIRAGDPFYNPNLEPLIDYEMRQAPLVGSARALAEARAPGDGPPTRPPMLIDIDEPRAERPSPERFEPVTMARTLIEAEHQARYQWATQAVRGRTVLDAGCGLGYGTVILAEAGAAHAIGIDLSAHAIADARALAGSRPVEYRVGDLHELPFDARAFDVVVCFEAIEHMHDVEGALDEFQRVLTADGLLLISSPNRGIYPGGNPYHLNELTAEELQETLERRFEHVTLFRQHPWTASAILSGAELFSEDPDRQLEVSTRKTVAVEPGSELYTLAAASNAHIPALGGVGILTDPLEVGRLVHGTEDAVRRAGSAMDEAERARTRLLEAEQAGEDARREALALRTQIEALEGSQSWRLTAPLRRAKRIARRLRAE